MARAGGTLCPVADRSRGGSFSTPVVAETVVGLVANVAFFVYYVCATVFGMLWALTFPLAFAAPLAVVGAAQLATVELETLRTDREGSGALPLACALVAAACRPLPVAAAAHGRHEGTTEKR